MKPDPHAASAARNPDEHARIVPYADVMALIDERNRLSDALEKAERECERLRGFPRDMVAWEDVEIGLRRGLPMASLADTARVIREVQEESTPTASERIRAARVSRPEHDYRWFIREFNTDGSTTLYPIGTYKREARRRAREMAAAGAGTSVAYAVVDGWGELDVKGADVFVVGDGDAWRTTLAAVSAVEQFIHYLPRMAAWRESQPKSELRIVIDVESDEPELLGTYVENDAEFGVWYTTSDGRYKWAPEDCVRVVKVEL